MPALIATRRFIYGTRRLSADDSFEANNTDARILVAIGKAKYATRAIITPPHNPAQDAAVEAPQNPQDANEPVESTQAMQTAEKPRRGRPRKSKVND